MGFFGAALSFPAVIFSFALLVVIGYWILVLLGGIDIDALDSAGEGDGGDSDGDSGLVRGLGLGGVPVTVALSLLIVVAWFVSLAGHGGDRAARRPRVATGAVAHWARRRCSLGEAQTLASGAEANLLKLAELDDRRTSGQARRWAEVKAAYLRAKALGGTEDDPVSRAVGAVGLLADRVGSAIDRAADRLTPVSE